MSGLVVLILAAAIFVALGVKACEVTRGGTYEQTDAP